MVSSTKGIKSTAVTFPFKRQNTGAIPAPVFIASKNPSPAYSVKWAALRTRCSVSHQASIPAPARKSCIFARKYPLSLEEIAAGVRELPYIKQRYTRIRIFHFHFFMNVFMNSPLRKFRFHLLHGSHVLMPHDPVPKPYAQSLRRMVRKHFPVSP